VIGVALGALLVAVYVAPVAALFRFAPLGAVDLAAALAAGLGGFAALEGAKWLRRRTGRRTGA
jgi:membrane protein implicated in regulation of membrane protease activity